MDQPLVSIVIPVYNKAAYIRETLDSALAQTYPNIEIILVDDGSTDSSLEILKTYFEKYPDKITLIDQENKGVSAATNTGIQAASGDYIQFLDADDVISPAKIEAQVKILNGKSKLTMASCEWVTFTTNTEVFQSWKLKVFKSYFKPMQLLLDFFEYSQMMQPGVYLCSKKLIELAGPWNENLSINQDGEFFLRVLLAAEEVIFEPSEQVFYRKPGVNNVSQQKSYQASQSLLESYRCYQRYFLEKDDSERVRVALAKNYLRFIYVTHPNYPDLIEEAEREIEALDIPKKVSIGGPKFNLIANLIGFKNAVRLKRWVG